MAPLLTAQTAPSSPTATPAEPEPRYDAGATVDTMMVVMDIREVPRNSPLSGTHLTVRPESAKAGTDTMDVYLGPADFLKELDCNFAKGDRIEVKGSKVKYSGSPMVLAREIRRNSSTVYLRDDHGAPYWKAAGK
jgi:DNA/RNA endonuclease YhcR with UshA esterase domain